MTHKCTILNNIQDTIHNAQEQNIFDEHFWANFGLPKVKSLNCCEMINVWRAGILPVWLLLDPLLQPSLFIRPNHLSQANNTNIFPTQVKGESNNMCYNCPSSAIAILYYCPRVGSVVAVYCLKHKVHNCYYSVALSQLELQ